MIMKTILTLAVTFLLSFGAMAQHTPMQDILDNNDKGYGSYLDIPFTKAGQAEPVHLRDYEGQNVMIHFWATWCHVCMRHMDNLSNLQEIVKDKNVKIINITQDNSLDRAVKYMDRRGFGNLELYHDDGVLLDVFAAHAVPITFLMDKEGKHIADFSGYIPFDSEPFIDFLGEAFGE